MKRVTVAVLAAITLAGCGGSDKKKENELTGILQAGGVAGVHYETATRSGQTDAQGTFRYLAGESVKFSVGAIDLGSVTGAATVTTFTLAGGTPPTTEIGLRRELELAQRGGTALGRAINIQRLFIVLDADNNPANGMDVGSQSGALANARMDLDARPNAFAARAEKLAPNLTQNLPISTPLVLLYRALGIQVPVHMETNAQWKYSVVVLPAITREAFASYTPEGRRETQGSDEDGDGQPDVLSAWKYDSLGRVTDRSYSFSTLFGSSFGTAHSTYEFSPRGTLLGGRDERDSDGDGLLNVVYRHDFTPDSHGFPVSESITTDQAADGIVDARQTTTNAFDARHNLKHQELVYDFQNDAVNDGKTLVDADYDAQDRLLEVRYQYDQDGDGILDTLATDSYQYGSSGPATGHVSDTDFDADGIVDSRTVESFKHDRDGYLLQQVTEFDDGIAGVDGVADFRQVMDVTWDPQHRLDTQTSRVDYDGDGTYENVSRALYTYDSAGNPLTSTIESDLNDDGELEQGYITTYVYGANGEMTGVRSQVYSTYDSQYRELSTATVATTTVNDGVTSLAQQYLDGFGVMPLAAGGYVSAFALPPP